MYKQVLQDIEGVEIYPIISLIIFTVFFAVMLYFTFRSKKSFINHMSSLPLEPDTQEGGYRHE